MSVEHIERGHKIVPMRVGPEPYSFADREWDNVVDIGERTGSRSSMVPAGTGLVAAAVDGLQGSPSKTLQNRIARLLNESLLCYPSPGLPRLPTLEENLQHRRLQLGYLRTIPGTNWAYRAGFRTRADVITVAEFIRPRPSALRSYAQWRMPAQRSIFASRISWRRLGLALLLQLVFEHCGGMGHDNQQRTCPSATDPVPHSDWTENPDSGGPGTYSKNLGSNLNLHFSFANKRTSKVICPGG